jgi:hypothetical protein
MTTFFTKLFEQPYWIIALGLGAALVVLSCGSITKDSWWTPHPPTTMIPVAVGVSLLLVSVVAFAFTLLKKRESDLGTGIDLTTVKEKDGVLSTTVAEWEIRVVNGRLEEHATAQMTSGAIVLPCNEYFDDDCAADSKSALGAYVSRVFEGQAEAFTSLAKQECRNAFGTGVVLQKTNKVQAESFGVGRCLLLEKPLGRSIPIVLLSTARQRAGEGLAGRISYLFDGMRELVKCLSDTRISEVTMPVMSAGHAGVYAPLALIGLLSAIAEAARYAEGRQRLRRVTIVVFQRDTTTAPSINPVVVRRALALIGSQPT